MEDFKKRLLFELYELQERTDKLDAFLANQMMTSKIDESQIFLMKKQLIAMDQYLATLSARVDSLTTKEERDGFIYGKGDILEKVQREIIDKIEC